MAHPSTRGDGWYLNQAQKIQVEQIWNAQAEQLQQMALRLVRDPESAEEIVQQVFLSVKNLISCWPAQIPAVGYAAPYIVKY